MNRNIHRQIAEERGVDIRFPSNANLMIDSRDRPYPSLPNDFSIYSPSPIILGYFTRMAIQEICMDWGVGNINSSYSNNLFGVTSPVTENTYTLDLSGNVFEGSTPISDYYDTIDSIGATSTRNPIILVNGIPTPIIPAELPLLDPEGAPIDISGSFIVGELLKIQFRTNFYTVANMADSIASILTLTSLNKVITYTATADSLLGVIISAKYTTGGAAATFTVLETLLSNELTVNTYSGTTNFYFISPNIMPWAYVNIQCDQLTYTQEVKDSTTSRNPTDVLYRWNFGWSAPPQNDKYGFPILQGYTAFKERRNIAFPKQIRWDPLQTVANLSFQSYVGDGFSGEYQLVPLPVKPVFAVSSSGYEFQITALLSEV